MKAYLITTGVIFALVTLLHIARMVMEWDHFGNDPWSLASFALLTLATAALTVWAWKLFPRSLVKPS
jgi:hypothetical protein